MSRAALEPAFVLHHRPYRDTSLLLELFTLSHGRVGVVARGARAPRSRTRALLQPFRPLLVSWAGRGELATLTAVELGAGTAPPAPARLMSAWYLNELLLKLLERHDPQQELFSRYAGAVAGLAAADAREERCVLRRFEKALLESLGYGLNLTHEFTTGRAVRADRCYVYRADEGPEQAGVADGERSVSGAALLALAGEDWRDDEHLEVARRVLGEAIERHLGGRPLRTRAVARATRRPTPATASVAAAPPGAPSASAPPGAPPASRPDDGRPGDDP